METLVGIDPPVLVSTSSEVDERVMGRYRKWYSRCDSWKMGFCHFMKLENEPTEKTLWFCSPDGLLVFSRPTKVEQIW